MCTTRPSCFGSWEARFPRVTSLISYKKQAWAQLHIMNHPYSGYKIWKWLSPPCYRPSFVQICILFTKNAFWKAGLKLTQWFWRRHFSKCIIANLLLPYLTLKSLFVCLFGSFHSYGNVSMIGEGLKCWPILGTYVWNPDRAT